VGEAVSNIVLTRALEGTCGVVIARMIANKRCVCLGAEKLCDSK